jgi:NTP pyrophosphatase (non-canonical NTP hydrolase)
MKREPSAIQQLLEIMARLRAPNGCPWDREQDHRSLRRHAIEEVYELIDAIDDNDDEAMADELGDLLLQVVFHCQMANERHAFDFDRVCRSLVEKLIRRHPHVFGSATARDSSAVWAQWDRIKQTERAGTSRARSSALDGIPRHLPALLRTEQLVKKATKARLLPEAKPLARRTKASLGTALFELAATAQRHGWSAEELLRAETRKRERALRRLERSALTTRELAQSRQGRQKIAGRRKPPERQ